MISNEMKDGLSILPKKSVSYSVSGFEISLGSLLKVQLFIMKPMCELR